MFSSPAALIALSLLCSCGSTDEPDATTPPSDVPDTPTPIEVPSTVKYYNGEPGMKIIGVLEVNDTNPLNCLGFTLTDEGTPFFDMVVLFAANINLNEEGKPYVSCNENVTALLNGRDKYLKPLQDKGIKVVLGILGNHDPAGISTLDAETAKFFASEVKGVCDRFNLDGIFLDDEYTDYTAAASGNYPGIIPASYVNASRLSYEIKNAQPERLLISYRYKYLSKAEAVDGVEPGEIFDYVVNDYWVTADPTLSYPGLTNKQAGTGSWNCSDWSFCLPSSARWKRLFSLEGMRDSGYGALMIFNFRCQEDYTLTPYILQDMETASNIFWNATLTYDGTWYPKDY